MTAKKYNQKSYHTFGSLAPNIYGLDLSNELLKIHFGQGAAKKSEVKVGVKKNLADQSTGGSVSNRAELANSFRLPTLTSDFFAAP